MIAAQVLNVHSSMKIGSCQCGMPFYGDDTVVLKTRDEWESVMMVRCQHCGHEGGMYIQLVTNHPGWHARVTL